MEPGTSRRIVTVFETAADAGVVEDVVLRALRCSDVVFAVQHPAADGTRAILSALMRRGLPVVIFDTPRPAPLSPGRRRDFCRNVRRFFSPDLLLWLGPRETFPFGSRQDAERAVEAPAQAPTREMWRRPDLDRLDPLVAGQGWREWSRRLLAKGRGFLRAPIAASVRPPLAVRLPDGQTGRLSRATRVSEPIPADESAGVLNASYHVDNFYLDCPPFRYLADRFGPASVLDVGCGLGGYLWLFQHWGVADAMGVDGLEVTLCPDAYLQHDLRAPLVLDRTFDLVICAEVVEHLPPISERIIVETIVRHAASRIVFSAARPGQPGRGHINCRPIEYWLERFRDAGWEPDPLDTAAVRSLSTFSWFRRNLVVLAPRGEDRVGRFGAGDLPSFEAEAVRWVDQRPAVHVYPLEESPPRLAADAAGPAASGGPG